MFSKGICCHTWSQNVKNNETLRKAAGIGQFMQGIKKKWPFRRKNLTARKCVMAKLQNVWKHWTKGSAHVKTCNTTILYSTHAPWFKVSCTVWWWPMADAIWKAFPRQKARKGREQLFKPRAWMCGKLGPWCAHTYMPKTTSVRLKQEDTWRHLRRMCWIKDYFAWSWTIVKYICWYDMYVLF